MSNKNEKPVSMNQLKAYLSKAPQEDPVAFRLEPENTDSPLITVKRTLPAQSYAQFVEDAAGMCFSEDSYHPEFRQISFDFVVIQYFTNLKSDNITMDHILQMRYASDLMSRICEAINADQLSSLRRGVSEMIRWRRESILCHQKQLLEQTNRRIEKEQDEILNSMQILTDQMQKMSTGLLDVDLKQLTEDCHKMASIDDKERVSNILELNQAEDHS